MANRSGKFKNGTDLGDESGKPSQWNDTFDAVIDLAGRGHSQGAYQTLQSSGSYENKDFLFADIFTSRPGVNKTMFAIDDSQDESSGDTLIQSAGWVSPGNVNDSSYSTFSTNTGVVGGDFIGFTFSAKTITLVDLKASVQWTAGDTTTIILQSFNGATWDDELTIVDTTADGGVDQVFELNKSVQGLRLYLDSNAGFAADGFVNMLRYTSQAPDGDAVYDPINDHFECKGGAGSYVSSSVNLPQNIKTLDGTEENIIIYGDVTNTANTSVTVDISDGTTTLLDQPLNTVVPLAGFSSGELKTKINLNTSDVNDTPTFKGYGGFIN